VYEVEMNLGTDRRADIAAMAVQRAGACSNCAGQFVARRSVLEIDDNRRGGSMRNIWTITTRELRAFLFRPIAYVVSALFLMAMVISSRSF